MPTTVRDYLGPAIVYWDPDGDNVELVCEGGVTIKTEVDTGDIKSDKTGTRAKDKVVTGSDGTITCNVSDLSLDTLAVLFPNATQVGSGETSRVELRTAVGRKLKALSKELLIKRMSNGAASSNTADWFTAKYAHPISVGDLSYTREGQAVVPVTFYCFPDTSNNNRIGFFGDEAAS